MCAKIRGVTNVAWEVSGIRSANFSYCAVQKAGCTMWIRLFKFFEGQDRSGNNPMTLTKYRVHYEGGEYNKQLDIRGQDSDFFWRSLRATTVRDPYTRLWSAYIDKFILPDFWVTKGKHIIALVRPSPDPKSLECGHDVTFPEFIEYILKVGHQFAFVNQDKHWLPASDICDPCYFKPDIIGKQETFLVDLKYTLDQIGLGTWMKQIQSVDPTHFEIHEEVNYNFKIVNGRGACLNKVELTKRLWTAFVLNGYIPVFEEYPAFLMQEDEINEEAFEEIVMDIRSKYNVTNAEKKAIRQQAVKSAFKKLAPETMESLKKFYQLDFELFDYDPDPLYLK